MGVYQEAIDFADVFTKSSNVTPTVIDYSSLGMRKLKDGRNHLMIVNDMPDVLNEDREIIRRAAYTEWTGDTIENIPSCRCGYTTDRHNRGVICDMCGHEVQAHHENEIHAKIWIKAPEGIPALIHPAILDVLVNRFNGANRFDVIRWLCDTSYRGPSGKPPVIAQLEKEIPRGLTNFYHHFDEIMERLFSIRALRRSTVGPVDHVKEFVKQNRSKIFTQQIPIPNRILFVIENTNFGSYMDTGITGAINALWLMTGIDSEVNNFSQSVKENRAVKALFMLKDFYIKSSKDTLMRKEGMLRAKLFSSRQVFAMRTVIGGITDAHHYSECHIPWGMATTVFRFHILNRLRRMGWEPKQSQVFLENHLVKHHPLLEEIMNELIESAKELNGVGIPCCAVRYPTLQRGSIQMWFVSKIKTNTTDVTTSIPILGAPHLNAD